MAVRFPHCRLHLTSGRGEKERVPMSSGLNWGQRPGRDPNQAYLAVSADIQREGFFPDIGIKFRLLTDDGYDFICVRAQQNGKAIHTENNSDLGKYFRTRIGVRSGGLVTIHHLLAYGKTWVDIHRVQDLVYHLDFSVN